MAKSGRYFFDQVALERYETLSEKPHLVAVYVGHIVTHKLVDILLKDCPDLPPALGGLLRLDHRVEFKRPETARRWLGDRTERWRGWVGGRYVVDVDVTLEFAGRGFWLEVEGVSLAGDLT